MDLVETLERFNRKERYWLLRFALGADRFRLSRQFLDKVQEAVGLRERIPDDAWWAMDYHIDWLMAALHYVREHEKGRIHKNYLSDHEEEIPIIHGNQEDIDLVIAFGRTLILCEAKADTGWSVSQVKSKLRRLSACQAYAGDVSSSHEVRFNLLLLSPRQPPQLQERYVADGDEWPAWARRGETLNFLQLPLGDRETPFLRVSKSDLRGKRHHGFVIKDYSIPQDPIE